MTNDTISDLLCRIRNGQLARHNWINVSNTATTRAICKIFEKEGFIQGYAVDKTNSHNLTVNLKYGHNRPAMQHCYRISKPSLRIYTKHKNLTRLLNGMGTIVLSTNQGIMTERDARTKHVGGEVLFAIW